MAKLIDAAGLLFAVSLVSLFLSAAIGVVGQKMWRPIKAGDQNEFNLVQSAALTLLGLIVGFSFAMAISRYDQRKNLEEAEANAIGTEYVRADLMPESEASAARGLLKRYLDRRIFFYLTSDPSKLEQNRAESAKLEAELWAAARATAHAQPTPISALVVSGMNDVLNSADYTQAAWLNRIPITAWWLMVAIGVACNVTLGFGAQRFSSFLLFVVPMIASVSFFLIADIDSPRSGLVQVLPQNLMRLATSLSAR